MGPTNVRCFSCGHESESVASHRDHDRGHFVATLMGNQEYLEQIAKDQAEQKKEE